MVFIKARWCNFYYAEQGEGPPILLIPPAGSTASTWGTLAGDLAAAGRVIAYDRRGYTRSGGEVVRSAGEHTRDAAAILDALDARPTVVAGTSAGATIALDLAVRRPDLVRAVVVHEAAWRQTARENGRSVVADLKSSMGSYPHAQDLATITAPVVCTYGSRSRGYMRSLTRSLAQAIPAASVREIGGTAHAVPFDASGTFAQVIVDAMHSGDGVPAGAT